MSIAIHVARDDATGSVDITEGVQIMYDTILASLDWQSGFLGVEELEALAKVGEACGFESIEEVYRKINIEKAEAARQQELRDRAAARERQTAPTPGQIQHYRQMINDAIGQTLVEALNRTSLHVITPTPQEDPS